MQQTRRKRRVLTHVVSGVAISLASLFVSLAALEVGIRVYALYYPGELAQIRVAWQQPRRYHVFDPIIGWRLMPGYSDDNVSINPVGYRSSISDPVLFCRDKTKVLILGDSMAFGLGVGQDRIFTELLNKKHKNKYCFINAAASGYNTAQELLVFSDFVISQNFYFAPDIVLLLYTQANDMWMNVRTHRFNASYELRDGTLKLLRPSRIISPPLYKYSYVYRLLDAKAFYGRDPYYLWQRLDYWWRGGYSYAWLVTRAILSEISRLSVQIRAELVVLDIPTQNQLIGVIRNRKRQALLRAWAAERGVTYHDLEQFYPENFKDIFLVRDSHWNEKGHSLVARVIEEEILRNRPTPPSDAGF